MRNRSWLKGSTKRLLSLCILSIVGLGSVALAQNTDKPASGDPLSGKYEGMMKSPSGVDTRLTLELTNDKGKVTGRLVTPAGAPAVMEGSFTDGKLALKTGSGQTAGSLNATLQGDKLSGEWIEGQQKRTVEFKRLPADTSSTSASAAKGATVAPVSLEGQWDGMADTQGQGFPFLLTLKLDGEKVSGESSSSLGVGAISSGTFKDGKLAFTIDSPSGAIVMSAVLKDGELAGDFDYAGQAQGRWTAKKKTP